MKKVTYLFSCILFLCFTSCDTVVQKEEKKLSDPKNKTNQQAKNNKPKTEYKEKTAENGTKYTIFSSGKKEGRQPRLEDQLVLNLQYSTEDDSIIYSSFARKAPMDFKFSQSLFRGALTEGLTEMYPGDSAVFIVPPQLMYPTRLPSFLKGGKSLKYTIKLIDVDDPKP